MGSGHTWDLDTHGNTLANMRDDTGGGGVPGLERAPIVLETCWGGDDW